MSITSSITGEIPKKNTVKTCEYVLFRFAETFADRKLEEVSQEEVLDFLIKLTNGNKQSTKRNRYSTLSSFYNFTINTASPELINHCTTPIIKKIFRRATCIQWKIIDKETIDEIIFRTMNTRNRIIMELMARGGMRIGEVLKLTPNDIDDRKLIIQEPKSGRESEVVFIPRKLLLRLNDYVECPQKTVISNRAIWNNCCSWCKDNTDQSIKSNKQLFDNRI